MVEKYVDTDNTTLSRISPKADHARIRLHPHSTGNSIAIQARLLIVGVCAITLVAFMLRALFIDEQSAYMDEGNYILTGRTLIEHHTEYARALEWTFGSYLWPLVAGVADMRGGLRLVRLLTSSLGAVMALNTALMTFALVPPHIGVSRRRTAALLAGAIMAVMPTAIAVGRFGTYDALAGTAFMGAVAVLMQVRRTGRRGALLVAAGLMFIAFLSKYVVVVYFPFICLYLLLSSRNRAVLTRNLCWFVMPLSAMGVVYFFTFHAPLLALLRFSTTYGGLKSPTPLREYVWQRLDLWLLAGIAACGWRCVARSERLITVGGAGIMIAFQAIARPDFDWWKHSIYPIFFLAPLAGVALAMPIERLFLTGSNAMPHYGIRRIVGLALIIGVVMSLAVAYALRESRRLVTFYPNLNPALSAIRARTAQAHAVLTDDSAVRYYLYPRLSTDNVTDPFSIAYQGEVGIAGYRNAIIDRYFDVIVLDGGITAEGRQIRGELGELIQRYYDQVYATSGHDGAVIEIYQVHAEGQARDLSTAGGSTIYRFDTGIQGWGGHPQDGEQQPGLQVAISQSRTAEGWPSLQFTVTDQVSLIGVRKTGSVREVRARIYVTPNTGAATYVTIGMVGFDQDWQWHDDGFRQTIPVGVWADVTWDLAQPGVYNEIGLQFPAREVKRVDVAEIEILS